MRCLLFSALLLLAATTHAQWQLQDARTTADLRGIDNVGGGVAWASGSEGTILRTEDAGFVWQLCAKPPGGEHLDFRAIQAFDNNTAIAMSSGKGDLSRLYKTTDGCQTWKLVFTNPDKDGFFDALSLNAPKRDVLGRPLKSSHGWGYVLGDPAGGTFRLFSTRDGGETWRRRLATERGPKGEGCKIDDFKAGPDEAAFAASNQSLLALEGDYLLFVTGGSETRLLYNDVFSLDGALCHESIHYLKLPLASGRPSSGAFAVAATPDYRDRSNRPDKLVIVGGDYTRAGEKAGTATTVLNVGVPFRQSTKASRTPPHGFRSAVAYDSKTKTWITVGPTAPTSPPTTAATGELSNPTPLSTTPPTPTSTGTPSRSPTPSAPTAASASSAPLPSIPQNERPEPLLFCSAVAVASAFALPRSRCRCL